MNISSIVDGHLTMARFCLRARAYTFAIDELQQTIATLNKAPDACNRLMRKHVFRALNFARAAKLREDAA